MGTKKFALLLVFAAVVTSTAWGQGMGFGGPPKMAGLFNPVVGSGAEYQIKNTTAPGPSSFAFAVVGKESVNGAEGYWFEIRMMGGPHSMVMKQLMVVEGGTPQVKRMIMQTAGRPPMEMPVGMMNQAMAQHHPSNIHTDAKGLGQLVGTETITVPAGTFVCQHYRENTNGRTSDLWISTKISPYGLVKLEGPGTTMVLTKVLEHQTSQIQGEPQKFPMPMR